MSNAYTIADYTSKFELIAEQIQHTLEEYGTDLDERKPADSSDRVMSIMVEVAKMQALQAIALGIQALVEKEN